MKYSYDELWKIFVLNCQVDKSTLPQTEQGQYDLIFSGIEYYNTLVEDDEIAIIGNEYTEQININKDGKKNAKRLRLIAYCMRYRFLENQLLRYEEIWQPLMADLGQKNYRDQVSARKETLYKTEREIIRLLNRLDDMEFLNG